MSMRTQKSPARMQVSPSDSVHGHIKVIEEIIGDSQSVLREYKKEIELLRQEIGLMENHLST